MMLQYNKLYQSLKKVSAEWHAGHVQWEYSWNYLKFFEDGIFIQASILGDSSSIVNKTFTRDSEHTTKGKYNIKNGVIELDFGTVQVSGAINNDETVIINGKLAWDLYKPVS